jgi:hypothetical protein
MIKHRHCEKPPSSFSLRSRWERVEVHCNSCPVIRLLSCTSALADDTKRVQPGKWQLNIISIKKKLDITTKQKLHLYGVGMCMFGKIFWWLR